MKGAQIKKRARTAFCWPVSISSGCACPVINRCPLGSCCSTLFPPAWHQPDLFAANNRRRQKLSPLVDRINDRYGRSTIGFGLLPPEVRAFKGHAAFQRVPESWGF
jgi:hypothetical protein